MYIQDVSRNQANFERMLEVRKDLPPNARLCFNHNSVRDSSEYWLKAAGSSITKYDEQRQRGWRDWARSAESAAAAAGNFMKGFEPLLAVIANTAPEVGAAIGIISGFFAVAAARSRTNDLVTSQMATIMDRLPGLQRLESIYSEIDKDQAHLRRKITLAYYSVVDFAIVATRYYLRSGLKRWWIAVSDPDLFTDASQKVQTNFEQVRSKSEELLVWTVHDVRRKLQHDIEEKNIIIVKTLLGLSHWSSKDQEKRLKQYQKELSDEEKSGGLLDWMSSDKVHEFRRREVFADWESCSGSEMLILLAGTDLRLGPDLHCWMSPIALTIINELSGNSLTGSAKGPLFGYELVFCILDPETRTSVHDLASELLLGLLGAQKLFELPDLCAKLETYRTVRKTGSEREKKKALKAACATVAGLLAPGLKVCLVVDRIDRCKEQTVIFEILVDILAICIANGCCLKILTVANATYWDLNPDREKDLASQPAVRLFTATRGLPMAL